VTVLVLLALVPATAAGGPAVASGPTVDRTVRDPRIVELSGLAVSPTHPGVLWAHNDSGNPPVVYALRPDGAVAAAVRVRGVADVDWEAIASYRGPDGVAMLAVGDIGDNAARRPSVQVVLLPEPALHDATVSPRRVLRLRYPGGAADAETLLVDAAAGRMYVVTKGFGSVIYQVPTDVWPGRPGAVPADAGTLLRIATVPLLLVTDGVMAAGHHPLLRTYGELAVLPPVTPGVVGGTLEPLSVTGLPREQQGEALAPAADGGLLLGSEGRDQPVLHLPMPADVAGVLRPAAPAGATATARPGAVPAARTGAGGPGAGARWFTLPFLGTAMLVAAGIGVLVARSGRTRRTG